MLDGNYPNPFNPSTVISFSVPLRSPVSLKVFNLLGQEIATLVEGVVEAGYHTVEWRAEGRPTGVYFLRMTGPAFTKTTKMLLLD